MRILMVTPTYPPTKCGMADYTERLCQNLSKTNDVYVLTTKIKNTSTKNNVFRVMNNWSILEYEKVKKFTDFIKPDIMHIQYHENDFPKKKLAAFLPFLFRKKCKIITSLAFFNLRQPFFVQMIMKHSHCLTVTTEQDYLTIAKKFPKYKNKVYKVFDGPNITDDGNFVDRKKIRKQLNVKEDEILLVNFGFLKEDKGIEEIIFALRDVLNRGYKVKVLMISEFHHDKNLKNYQNKIRLTIKKLALENNIIWSGYVEKNQVSNYIKSCDIGVMPFRDGISGMRSSYWSLLSHELPTITTRSEFVPPGLENKKNTVLIPSQNYKELSKAISFLINNKSLKKMIGKNGKKIVDEKYGWTRIVREIVGIYDKN